MRDCNFNGVTPETEETPVTDVTASKSPEPVDLSAADEQLLRELTERARGGGPHACVLARVDKRAWSGVY